MSDAHEGVVARRRVAPGSKSEREAVVLETGDRTLLLRRRGGHPFADPELDALVGRRIRARGTEHRGTLLMDEWEPA